MWFHTVASRNWLEICVCFRCLRMSPRTRTASSVGMDTSGCCHRACPVDGTMLPPLFLLQLETHEEAIDWRGDQSDKLLNWNWNLPASERSRETTRSLQLQQSVFREAMVAEWSGSGGATKCKCAWFSPDMGYTIFFSRKLKVKYRVTLTLTLFVTRCLNFKNLKRNF